MVERGFLSTPPAEMSFFQCPNGHLLTDHGFYSVREIRRRIPLEFVPFLQWLSFLSPTSIIHGRFSQNSQEFSSECPVSFTEQKLSRIYRLPVCFWTPEVSFTLHHFTNFPNWTVPNGVLLHFFLDKRAPVCHFSPCCRLMRCPFRFGTSALRRECVQEKSWASYLSNFLFSL